MQPMSNERNPIKNPLREDKRGDHHDARHLFSEKEKKRKGEDQRTTKSINQQ
jgi:hypothetical protein